MYLVLYLHLSRCQRHILWILLMTYSMRWVILMYAGIAVGDKSWWQKSALMRMTIFWNFLKLFKLADGDLSDDAFKNELINSMLMSPSKDKFNHHLNKNYDWMDDYMIWKTNFNSNWNIYPWIFLSNKSQNHRESEIRVWRLIWGLASRP